MNMKLDEAIALALGQLEQGNLVQAESLLKKVLAAVPDQPDALHFLGVIAHQVGKDDVAKQLIGRAVAIMPSYAAAHSNLGNVLKNLGEFDAALAAYSKALALKPSMAQAHNNCGVIYQECGKLDQAIVSFKQAAQANPAYSEALYNLGYAQQCIDDYDKAQQSYLESIKQNPELIEAHNNLGFILCKLDQPDQAIQHLNRALEINPTYAQAHINLGKAYFQLGESEKAIASYSASIRIDPNFTEAYNNLGMLYRDKDDHDGARAYYLKAIEISPEYSEAHFNLAEILHVNRKYSEAIEHYRRATAKRDDYIEAYRNCGQCYCELGEYKQAITQFQSALQVSTNSALLHLSLANAFRDDLDFDSAIKHYHTAIDIEPEYADDAYRSIAVIYDRRSDLPAAQGWIKKALQAKPDSLASMMFYAKLLVRSKKFAEAQKLLEGLDQGQLAHDEAATLFSLLGNIADKTNQPNKAFKYFIQANQHKEQTPQGKACKPASYVQMVDNILAKLNTLTVDDLGGDLSGEENCRDGTNEPNFLVGFPRSGTTLIDQILNSHPKAQVLEEQPIVENTLKSLNTPEAVYPDIIRQLSSSQITDLRALYFEGVSKYIQPAEGSLFIDKLPLNIMRIMQIKKLFPSSKIIFVLRHPCDVILSNFMQNYSVNNAMANFHTLESTANLYLKVFSVWEATCDNFALDYHTVRYESLVDDMATETQSLLDYLGLDWSDAVLRFDKNAKTRLIRTPSYDSVTQPIYQRSVGRWKQYEKHFSTILPALEPICEKYQYDL